MRNLVENNQGGLNSVKLHKPEDGSATRRTAAIVAGLGVAFGAAAIAVELNDEPKQKDRYVYTDLECRPLPNRSQEIPYDIESGNLHYLVRQIKTVDHKGSLEDGPCYDEALEIVKQQTAEGYPYDGTVLLPKFLVPEGMTLRELKNQQ